MDCPKGHGSMDMYDSSLMKERYICTTCDLKLELDTDSGKVIQIAGGLAAVGSLAFVAVSWLLGNGGGNGGGNA